MTAPSTPVRAFGPGRVNLIGEHTDYNDGLCLPFAIELGITVEARARTDHTIHVRTVDLGQEDTFDLGDPPPADGWRAFVRGVTAELQRAGHRLRPAELTISSTLPRGSGLASSAALEVALALALLDHSGHPEPDRRALARLCARVENDWVGAHTGLLDQLAVLFGQPDHALRLDMHNLAIDPVPLQLDRWKLVIVESGATRSHTDSGYNDRRRECRQACARLGLRSLRYARDTRLIRLPTPLDRRVRHVLAENQRVEAAVVALRIGDLAGLGRLLNASHASLRDLYEVSVPAVESVVARLLAAGAVGARMVGGGFGGSVLALFPPDMPLPADAIALVPGPAARLVAN